MKKRTPVLLATVSAVLLSAEVAPAQPAPPPPPPPGEADPKPADPAAKPKEGEPKPKEGEPKPKEGGEAKPDEGKPPPGETPPPTEAAGGGAAAGAETEGPPVGPAGPPGPEGMLWPQPGTDVETLKKQGADDPKKKTAAGDPDRVYAEDWWSHARPILELHGYFRVRAELFHNFSLGRIDRPNNALWPMPIDNHYNSVDQAFGPRLCTADESAESNLDSDDPADGLFTCKNKTQAGANLRFRLNPEIHISDNLRVMSQIDLLDNLVLGSTPEGYSIEPGASGGYDVRTRAGFAPLGAFDSTQAPPQAGTNGLRDSIRVKRAWAEYLTPVGMLRFGRMPSHWGLGILANSGDGYDDDFQSTADRIMLVTGIKSLDLYFAGAWDFTNEGSTSDTLALPQAQPYDRGQLDDVDQYVFVVVRRRNPELAKLELAKGKVVLNGGAYIVHRRQLIANDVTGGVASGANVPGAAPDQLSGNDTAYARRGASAWIPDGWLQLRYKKFRFELEAVTIQASIENVANTPGLGEFINQDGENGWKVRQYGIATEIEQRLVEDRLKLEFDFGYASGDPDVLGANTGSGGLSPGFQGLQPQETDDRTISTFRFHPNYKVDLILHRNLMTRVQGSYYFRPEVEYDFIRDANGQRFGGNFAAIWTRASEFVQTPGHSTDLGIELNFSLYFQSKDGSLNDHHEKMGGFYTMLQYGVLFPLAGLDYQDEEERQIVERFNDPNAADTSTAQILRWYLGVLF